MSLFFFVITTKFSFLLTSIDLISVGLIFLRESLGLILKVPICVIVSLFLSGLIWNINLACGSTGFLKLVQLFVHFVQLFAQMFFD